jgi:uncharacterized membrane protein YfcA
MTMPEGASLFFWLWLSALAAGAVNSVAGGGTLLTFPALLAALSPLGPEAAVIANATSTVALVPGSLAGAWGYRSEMRVAQRWNLLLLGPSLLGGAVGSLLVTRLHPKIFEALVPWLILTAALLFLIQPALGKLIGSERDPAAPSGGTVAAVLLFQFLVAVYGGYFGAGIGILMLSALALMGLPGVHQMNAVKTFLAFCINGVSVVVFVLGEKVHWPYALVMAVGAILGGYLGARIARRIRPRIVRWFIIAVGLGLAAFFFYKQIAGTERSHSFAGQMVVLGYSADQANHLTCVPSSHSKVQPFNSPSTARPAMSQRECVSLSRKRAAGVVPSISRVTDRGLPPSFFGGEAIGP